MAQRRLAAIMFTDIIGYDSLLREYEKKAFEDLRKNQRIHRLLIKRFNGRWLKEMESGTLASFSSNIDAVMCGISIQRACEELEIPIRIGIHLGDVIFEKKDVLGDGVNIASRIQNAINTSGIIISEKVYSDIANKEGLDIKYLGDHVLKGVIKPFGIYKVTCTDEGLLDFTIDTGELVRPLHIRKTIIAIGIIIITLLAYASYSWLINKSNLGSESQRSILVMPFDNFTGIDTLDYLVAGIHAALISNIQKVSELKVKCKTTANAYKDSEESISEIASELGINVIVEGSVLSVGDSINLQLGLVSTYDEEHLWIKEYHVEISRILNLFNEITKEIAKEIDVALTPQEELLLAESTTVDRKAYEAYLKGRHYYDQLSKESLEKAEENFKIAIGIEPDWAPPYTGIAHVGIAQKQMAYAEPATVVQKIYEYLYKALELDPNSANSHSAKASMAVWTEWDWERGEREFRKALELNPSDAACRIGYAHLLMILHRSDEAMYQANLALELDPLRPFVLGFYAIVMNSVGNYQSAITHAQKALSIDPDNYFAYSPLEIAYYLSGNYNKSIEIMIKVDLPQLGNYASEMKKAFDEHGYVAAMEVLIKKREETTDISILRPTFIAEDYFRAEKYEKALDWLERGYEIHDPNMAYLSTYIWVSLKNNPRYIELLKKMNLPLP